MASSGSADYTVTASQLIQDALEELGVVGAGQTVSAEDSATALRALNLLVKQWMGPGSPVTPGLKMWKRRQLTLDLTSTDKYALQIRRLAFTSGGTTAIAVGDTIAGATSSATAKVMAVEVTSGSWAGGDAAGELIIEGQSGTFQSENLNVGASSNLATISGNSEQYGPPTEIMDPLRRTSDGEDTPMDIISQAEYMGIGDKDASGTPTKIYYEKRIDELRIYLNATPSVTTDSIVFVALLPIEDFDSTKDNPDFTREWHRTLKWNLAKELLAKFPSSKDRAAVIIAHANESLGIANMFEPENSDVYFEPDKDL